MNNGPIPSNASTRDDLAAAGQFEPSARHKRVDLHDPSQRALIEAAIASVPGVIGARLVAGFEREVDELHVLTVIDRSAKQTVRDVQTVLMARFGVPTDHRVISVVQLEEGRGLPPLTVRPAIEEVGVVVSGTTVQASVVLGERETLHRGTATGAATRTGRHRSVAHATLAAIRPLLSEDLLVELEGVDLLNVATHRLATVVLQIRSARAEIVLCGTAIVNDAPDEAIARSILDALNRTLAEPPI